VGRGSKGTLSHVCSHRQGMVACHSVSCKVTHDLECHCMFKPGTLLSALDMIPGSAQLVQVAFDQSRL
jgi:hypothetical protein